MTSRPLAAQADDSRHIPVLDGVRGIAILLVLLHHLWAPLGNRSGNPADRLLFEVSNAGWIGVDLFFVLSGLLITGILLDAKDGTGYFRSFYARRFLRIFPVYYGFLLVLIVFVPLVPALADDRSLAALNHYQLWFWPYLQNVAASRSPLTDYGNLWAGHLWSLAVEEQFYLLWPGVVLICSRRALGWLCVACVVGAPLLRIIILEVLTSRWANGITVYTMMPTRVDTLGAGALIAVALRTPGLFDRLAHYAGAVLALAAACVLAFTLYKGGLNPFEDQTQRVVFSALALGFAAFIVLVLSPASLRLRISCEHPALTFLGRYSYALYVFHFPIAVQLALRARSHDLIFKTFGSEIPAHIIFMLAAGALAIAASWLSWNLYERQFLKLKRYFPYGGPKATGPTPHVIAETSVS